METRELIWWRAPARLEDGYTIFDAAAAERYDVQQAGLDLLFEFANVHSARDAAEFVSTYGFLCVPPDDVPQERTSDELFQADQVRLMLGMVYGRQHRAPLGDGGVCLLGTGQDTLYTAFAGRVAAVPSHTLLGEIYRLQQAVAVACTRLERCLTCGRFFAPQHPQARYCRPACAKTAAKWRERRTGTFTGSMGLQGRFTGVAKLNDPSEATQLEVGAGATDR